MFKTFFLGLVDVSSLEINLALVKQGKKYPKLNDYTVRTYHDVFKPRKKKGGN